MKPKAVLKISADVPTATLLFLLDHLAIMGLLTAVSHYFCKALRGRGVKRKKKGEEAAQ